MRKTQRGSGNFEKFARIKKRGFYRPRNFTNLIVEKTVKIIRKFLKNLKNLFVQTHAMIMRETHRGSENFEKFAGITRITKRTKL